MAQTVKKVPIRRCLGCGEGKPKKELVRVVKSKDGDICLDETGRAAGRGAYVCRSAACLTKAKKRKSLERAFGAAIPDEVYDALAAKLEEPDG